MIGVTVHYEYGESIAHQFVKKQVKYDNIREGQHWCSLVFGNEGVLLQDAVDSITLLGFTEQETGKICLQAL